jgi:O-antigen/teichoic acid export membrane protein
MTDLPPEPRRSQSGENDRSRPEAILDLAMLFFSKTGAIVVGVLFLPTYHERLGNEAFSAVAVILSIQAFAVMIDLGMSTLVSRDVAHVGRSSSMRLSVWRQAEAALIYVYGLILLIVLLTCGAIGVSGPKLVVIVGCILLCLLTVLQNIGQTALLADKNFVVAGSIQIVGVIVRALATAVALTRQVEGLITFVVVQVAMMALHLLITRHFCNTRFVAEDTARELEWSAVVKLIRRGRSLVVSGLAAAAVLQLDKPLVSAFATASDISSYFLAMSVSILPTSLLAAPLVQYFQPQIIGVLKTQSSPSSNRIITRFTVALLCVVTVPSWFFWHWTEPIISMWLAHSDLVVTVSSFAKILLPAFALGALSYVPVVLLLAAQDFKYQAVSSVCLTALTLALVLACASVKRIDWVCFTYLLYFVLASISVWCRALVLPSTRQLARLSASRSALPLLLLTIAAATFAAVT